MSKIIEYRLKAVEHAALALSCKTDECREAHRQMAVWFLALAEEGWVQVGD